MAETNQFRAVEDFQLDDNYTGLTVWADMYSLSPGNLPTRYILDLANAGGAQNQIRQVELVFQARPFTVADGVDGITNEVLLTVVLDRLRSAQSGPGVCRENALAITAIEDGLLRLKERSRRIARERKVKENGTVGTGG